jgi:hypothetical protein
MHPLVVDDEEVRSLAVNDLREHRALESVWRRSLVQDRVDRRNEALDFGLRCVLEPKCGIDFA